jgi:1,4-alpha-glucan branching enzyme
MVSRPTYAGGLGFGLKWNMGWMHDTLQYMSKDPIYRPYHHDQLTFSMLYAFTENFVLPLSHDEVVHGKGSLLSKMPGDDWQKRANLRILLGYLMTHPGKCLLFMGGEFGQWDEWHHDRSLDWHLLDFETHRGIQRWVADLNRHYRADPALYEKDFTSDGFSWIDCSDVAGSVVSFLRMGESPTDPTVVIINFTPVVRRDYRIGLPLAGRWREVLNSDAPEYGGSGLGNLGGVRATPVPRHQQPYSASFTLPPLSLLVMKISSGVKPARTSGK